MGWVGVWVVDRFVCVLILGIVLEFVTCVLSCMGLVEL